MDFLSPETRRNPYPMYAQLRAAAPVLLDPRTGLWMVFDYESVKRAVFDHDAFSSAAAAPGGKPLDWLVFNDPPRHTLRRNIIMRAFTPRSIAELEPRIAELSRELLAQVVEKGEMDLIADYAGPLPTMVIAEMIGIPPSDRALFMRWSEAIVNLSYTIVGGEAAARAIAEVHAVKADIVAYVAEMAQERRTHPRNDLLTRLVEAEVDGEHLTDAELYGFFCLLLSAGTETTTNLIGNAIVTFLENRGQMERVQADLSLLPAAIEEVLRYRTPVQMMFRVPTRDVEMHGQTIPAGKLVLVMIGSANRDPRQFADPERFDIARDPNPHIAFGHGIHFCLGAALARLEGRVALTDLLALQDLQLASDQPWQPRSALHVLGPASLPIRFASRRPASAGR